MTWKAAARNTFIVALLCAAYVGFRIYQRNADNEAFLKKQEELHPRERPLPEIYKSEKLEFLAFYVSPRRIAAGERASLCYGVLNAKTVSAEPGIGPLTPSMSRCVTVAPARTTTYTLTATDASGTAQTREAVLTVR